MLVVVGLLGLLSVLGFFFYTFANQENVAAHYDADAAKEFEDPGLNPDTLFNFSLK